MTLKGFKKISISRKQPLQGGDPVEVMALKRFEQSLDLTKKTTPSRLGILKGFQADPI